MDKYGDGGIFKKGRAKRKARKAAEEQRRIEMQQRAAEEDAPIKYVDNKPVMKSGGRVTLLNKIAGNC